MFVLVVDECGAGSGLLSAGIARDEATLERELFSEDELREFPPNVRVGCPVGSYNLMPYAIIEFPFCWSPAKPK